MQQWICREADEKKMHPKTAAFLVCRIYNVVYTVDHSALLLSSGLFLELVQRFISMNPRVPVDSLSDDVSAWRIAANGALCRSGTRRLALPSL